MSTALIYAESGSSPPLVTRSGMMTPHDPAAPAPSEFDNQHSIMRVPVWGKRTPTCRHTQCGLPTQAGRRFQMDQMNWEQLEKRYSIVVEGNKATATRRGQLFGKVLTATATLGTKAVELKLWNGIEVTQLDTDHTEKFTESNLADELKDVCLFTLAQWEMAQAASA
jgi:hypothetical protein